MRFGARIINSSLIAAKIKRSRCRETREGEQEEVSIRPAAELKEFDVSSGSPGEDVGDGGREDC